MADLSEKELEALKAIGDSPARLDELTGAVRRSSESFTDFAGTLNTSSQSLGQLREWLGNAGMKKEELGNVTGTTATKFGLLTTALIGAREHFKGTMAGLDTGRLGSFTEQTKELVDTVTQQGTVLGVATEAGQKLFGMLSKMGVTGKELAAVMSMSGKEMAAFAQKVMIGADNSLRLQSTLTQAMAQAGNLNELYKGTGGAFEGVGDQLQNLNQVTSTYINAMKDADLVTHKGVEALGQYSAALLKIPGGAEAMVKGIDLGGTHMNTMAGIIQLADGAGLDINQTFMDIHKTVSSFGLGIEDSTKLVARYVDVSQDLHAQQNDVRDAILKTTATFKGFAMQGVDSAKMTQGLTDSVKNWAAALEKSGVPAQNALELASKYTASMESMNEAQESFVSQQTGGPGGLLGSLQFEDLMRKDPAAASAKMAQTMRQQMQRAGFGGQILSREQALQGGEAGARQYELQRQMAMSGVFGMKAGSKEEADAMIMALQKGGDIGKAMSEADKKKTESETMERGAAQEQLAYTGVKQATITAEYASLQAGDINLGFLQKAIAARSGAGTEGANLEGQNLLRQRMSEAGARETGPGTATLGKDVANIFSDARTYARGAISSAGQQISGTNTALEALQGGAMSRDQANTALDALRGGGGGETQPNNTASRALRTPTNVPGATGGLFGGFGQPGAAPQGMTMADVVKAAQRDGISVADEIKKMNAGKQVGAAVTQMTSGAGGGTGGTRTTGGTGGAGMTGGGGPVPVTFAPGTSIPLQITIKYPDGEHVSYAASGFNAPSQSPNKG